MFHCGASYPTCGFFRELSSCRVPGDTWLSHPYRGATFMRPPELAVILDVLRNFAQLSGFVSVMACDLLRPL